MTNTDIPATPPTINNNPVAPLLTPEDRWLRARLPVVQNQVAVTHESNGTQASEAQQLVNRSIDALNERRYTESKRLMRDAKRAEFRERYEQTVKAAPADQQAAIGQQFLKRKAQKLLTEVEVVPPDSSYAKMMKQLLAGDVVGTTVKENLAVDDVTTAWEELDKYATQVEERSQIYRDRVVLLGIFGLIAVVAWWLLLPGFNFYMAAPIELPTVFIVTLPDGSEAEVTTTTPVPAPADRSSTTSASTVAMTQWVGGAILLFALIGAVVSAMRSTLDQLKSSDALSETQALVNENSADWFFMAARLITGVLLAILASTLVFSGFINIGNVTAIKLVTLAIAAGFSQDFVISAIRSVTGEK